MVNPVRVRAGQTNALLDRAERELGYQPPAREHGFGLGIDDTKNSQRPTRVPPFGRGQRGNRRAGSSDLDGSRVRETGIWCVKRAGR